MNEITISKNTMENTASMAVKVRESFEIIEALSDIGNETAKMLISEQATIQKYQIGYVLGSLKGNLDCLPDEVASKQKMNGIPLDFLIKMKVDQHVLDVREAANVGDMTHEVEYHRKYRRLSELICGFGYNMQFIEERFESFFPNGMHMFVLGFAVGYSETFHEIAAKAGISTEHTDPKTQDIWKNWPYFLDREVHEYRIDGEYLFMYHGGHNCSGNGSIPARNNCHYVNKGVYNALKVRKDSMFIEKFFDLNF